MPGFEGVPQQAVVERGQHLAEGVDRDGYVPNVVYSCGGLIHDGELWLPYGASDARVGFATMPLDTLLAGMVGSASAPGGRKG